MIDSEFSVLLDEIHSASDFQTVLRAHKNFLATILRISAVDNGLVQEGIERVLQVCVRFIAICRLLSQQENENNDNKENDDDEANDENRNKNTNTNSSSNPSSPKSKDDVKIKRRIVPLVIPPEEIEGIKREFYTQLSYLFQIMRKVENRGLLFRLDFNGYLSTLSEELGAGS